MKLTLLRGLLAALLLGPVVAHAQFDHQLWGQLLSQHVVVLDGGRATQVNYGAMADNRKVLRQYLKSLEQVQQEDFDRWANEHQLAFLINAYNAWTVELILSRYPHLTTIKDIGNWFNSPWRREFIPLLGETRSLDDIEHGLIRGSGRYREPRIHFAVNCASIGCPALLAEAYEGELLEQQLERATRLFLMDRSRNRLSDGELQISKIFDWYQEDFETGWRDTGSLEGFLEHYGEALSLTESQRQQLREGALDIEFLDYDWGLNDVSPRE